MAEEWAYNPHWVGMGDSASVQASEYPSREGNRWVCSCYHCRSSIDWQTCTSPSPCCSSPPCDSAGWGAVPTDLPTCEMSAPLAPTDRLCKSCSVPPAHTGPLFEYSCIRCYSWPIYSWISTLQASQRSSPPCWRGLSGRAGHLGGAVAGSGWAMRYVCWSVTVCSPRLIDPSGSCVRCSHNRACWRWSWRFSPRSTPIPAWLARWWQHPGYRNFLSHSTPHWVGECIPPARSCRKWTHCSSQWYHPMQLPLIRTSKRW